MARHRRLSAEQPPAELWMFNPEAWPGIPGWPEVFEDWQTPPTDEWELAFARWKAARRAWIIEHPGTVLGGQLDLLRAARRIREARWRVRRESDVSRLRGM